MLENAQVPPQNLEAEESVLGAMMLAPSAIGAVTEQLQPRDFYRASHAKIYRAAVDLYTLGKPVDAITLVDALEENGHLESIGGKPRIHELANLVPAVSNAGHYASIVHEMALLRRFINVGHEAARMGYERPHPLPEMIERLEQMVLDVAQQRTGAELEHFGDGLDETIQFMQNTADQDLTGIPTGLTLLDEATGGFQPGNLIVVAGRPSMGKSALGVGFAYHAATQGTPAAVFTLEMSKAEVTQRLIARHTNVPLQRIRKPKDMTGVDWTTIINARTPMHQLPIHIDDSGDLRITELRSRARRLKQQHPDLGLIVVDYLQLMASADDRPETRTQEVSQISRGLKVLARDLDVPVIALSQLNRNLESRVDKRPMLSDLRESGSIEQDADLVLFVYRDEVYNKNTDTPGQAELVVAKHRQGPTATVFAHWSKLTARFSNV